MAMLLAMARQLYTRWHLHGYPQCLGQLVQGLKTETLNDFGLHILPDTIYHI